MVSFWHTILALVWKDVLLEIRTKDIMVSILSFAILSLLILNFALKPSPKTASVIAPGILWVAFTFAGVLGLARTFALEKDQGNLVGLMLAPVSGEALYLGKMLANLMFMLIAELALLPIFAVLFNMSPFQPAFLLVMFVATVGFAAVGTLFSAIGVNTRSRDIMLPVLFLPLVVPVIISAVVASSIALDLGPWVDMVKWIQLMVVFDILAVVLSALAFDQVLRE